MPESQADVEPATVRVPLYNFGKERLDVLQMNLRLGLEGHRWELANDGSSVTVELNDTDVVGVVRGHVRAIVDTTLSSSNFAVTPCPR